MKKFLFTTLSLAVAMSLNAAVLATAGDISVSDEDIAPLIEAQSMHAMGAEPGKITDEDKKNIVDSYIKYKLLMKEAKASGIEDSAEFKKQIDLAKEGIIFNMWQENEFKKVSVSDEEAKKYYDENGDIFTNPEEVSISHILVEDEKVAKELIASLAKAKKESLKDEFKKLATEKSIDPSAKENGGDLGSVRKGIFVQEFEDAAFALKDGEISKEPVKTQFGYHVIYKQGSKKAEKMPFDELKERIKEGLKGQKFKETLDKKADDLFEKAKVEYKMPLPAPKADEKAAPAKK